MRPGKQLMLAFALLVALLTGPGFGFCAPPPDTCAAIATLSLSDEQFGKPVLHLTATKVDVAPSLPAYCDVRGTMWPEIGFAVKLPIPWNGKFYMVGNGGKAGNIEEGAMANGLKLGYVTASTNTGHDNKREGGYVRIQSP
jgi:feruloyl esterase